MRLWQSLWVGWIVGLFYFGLYSGSALAASICARHIISSGSTIDSLKDHKFITCINDVATFECRSSLSLNLYKQCFIDASWKLIRGDGKEWTYDDDKDVNACYDEAKACRKISICIADSGSVNCAIDWGWGAGDNWCVRKDVTTVSLCQGDYPDNYKCKDKSCRIGNCSEHCGVRPTRFRLTSDDYSAGQ
jgi:hypothetical protein